MSKKERPYLFIFQGKLLEADSLLEVKVGLDSEGWNSLVAQTIDFYMQLDAVSHSKSVSLDVHDARIMKSLRRTTHLIKKIDFYAYTKYNNPEARAKYKKTIEDEIATMESTVNVSVGPKPDNDSDIIITKVSKLDN